MKVTITYTGKTHEVENAWDAHQVLMDHVLDVRKAGADWDEQDRILDHPVEADGLTFATVNDAMKYIGEAVPANATTLRRTP